MNCVCPNIRTPLLEQYYEAQDDPIAARRIDEEAHPLGLGLPGCGECHSAAIVETICIHHRACASDGRRLHGPMNPQMQEGLPRRAGTVVKAPRACGGVPAMQHSPMNLLAPREPVEGLGSPSRPVPHGSLGCHLPDEHGVTPGHSAYDVCA